MTKISPDWMTDLGSRPNARHVAWIGELTFAGCSETDKAGRTVRFSIVRPLEDRGKAHPFSAHTLRRKGFAGTRFQMSLSPIEISAPAKFGDAPVKTEGAYFGNDPEDKRAFLRATPEYLGEVLLLGWTDGPRGATVSFALPPDAPVHPFIGCNRPGRDVVSSQWMAVFVELSDEDTPVDQVQRAKVEAPKKAQWLSNVAAQMIKSERFQQFAEDQGDSKSADAFLKSRLGIDSKAELDTDVDAVERFEKLRERFVAWQLEHGYDPTR